MRNSPALPLAAVVSIFFLIAGLSAAPPSSPQKNVSPDPPTRLPRAAVAAMETINPERIRAHVRFLAHDLLEGRGTGQRGGDLAAEYIGTQFALYGLKPAGDNGTYMQKVPMVGVTPTPETTFSLVPSNGSARELKPLTDYVAYDETQRPDSTVNTE